MKSYSRQPHCTTKPVRKSQPHLESSHHPEKERCARSIHRMMGLNPSLQLVVALMIASIASGKSMEEQYEKAFYQETVKGNRSEALTLYREIAAQESTDENREVIIKALNRMLIIYSAPSAGAFNRAIEKLNLDFEKGTRSNNTKLPAIWGGGGAGYEFSVDEEIKKQGRYSCRIRQIDKGVFGTITGTMDPTLIAGRKIRVSGYLKLQDIEGSAGLWLRGDRDQKAVAFYNMHDQELKGTRDWYHYSFELDVPRNIDNVNFGTLLSGSGTLWVDEMSIEIIE